MPAAVCRNALVTGASRGIGRGIAISLSAAGWRVFITGRSADALESTSQAASELSPVGVRCAYIVCDHSNANDVSEAFRTVEDAVAAGPGDVSHETVQYSHGLDLLVSNAYGGVRALMDTMQVPIWEKSPVTGGRPDPTCDPGMHWDAVCDVGLKSSYTAMIHAMRIMIPNKRGLIVNVSSVGAISSLLDPLYSCGKAANDRLVLELAKTLTSPRDTGVRVISLWPGGSQTELVMEGIRKTNAIAGEGSYGLVSKKDMDYLAWNFETPLYVGKVIAAIAAEENKDILDRWNGGVVLTAEAAKRYGITDTNGEVRYSFRSLRNMVWSSVPWLRNSLIGRLIPDVALPWPLLLHAASVPPIVS